MVKTRGGPPSAEKRGKVVSDEEILSDESPSEGEGEEGNDPLFSIEETPEEAKIRMAKKIISQAQEKSEGADDDVQDVLAKYALEERGRLFIPVADTLPQTPLTSKFAKGHLNSVTCTKVARNGSVFTGSKDCCVIRWDLATMKKTGILKGFRHDRSRGTHFDEVLCLDISDDCQFLATGGKDRIIRLWNGETLDAIDILKGHRDSITGLAFQRNTHLLYSASMDRSVKVWNLDDMAYLNTMFGHQSYIWDMDSYTTERAITCSDDRTIRVWKSIEEIQQVYNGHDLSIDCVRIVSADTFVSGSQDTSISLWKVSKKKPVFTLPQAHGPGPDYWVTALAVLRNTDLLASGSHNGKVNLYKVSASEIVLLQSVTVPGYINALSFSRDGKYLVAGIGQDHRLGRWTSTSKSKNGICVIELGLELST